MEISRHDNLVFMITSNTRHYDIAKHDDPEERCQPSSNDEDLQYLSFRDGGDYGYATDED